MQYMTAICSNKKQDAHGSEQKKKLISTTSKSAINISQASQEQPRTLPFQTKNSK